MFLKIFCIILISSFFIFAETEHDTIFVIGSFGVDSVNFINNAHDSLRLNTVFHDCFWNPTYTQDYLIEAQNESLSVILANAGEIWPSRPMSWYCGLWHKLWESEDTIYLDHLTGCKVEDDSANNDYAWICRVDDHEAGLMQTGRWLSQLRIPTNGNYGTVEYTAKFRMKTANPSPTAGDASTTTKVCSLIVYGPHQYGTPPHDSIFGIRVLTTDNFPIGDEYYTFDIDFTKNPASNDIIYYNIWWYGNVDLWADFVDVKDCLIDSLVNALYDDELDEIAAFYSPFGSLFRFYLRDEPRYGHYEANSYIMNFLRVVPNYKYGNQALGGGGVQLFESYADSVKPLELMFDYYPLYGAGHPGGRIPEDSGSGFQPSLDSMCNQLADMRAVAIEHNLNFWFIPQAFGKYDSATAFNADSGGNEGRWRLPTIRELRCITWLSLAYGARGIMYFLYKTRRTVEAGHAEWMRGLWRYTNGPREPLYSEAKNINVTLDSICSILMTLTSDTVFKSSTTPPAGCFINWVSDTLMQIGTFHDSTSEYFIIVNRHCLPSENIDVKVHIENPWPTPIYLYDCLTQSIIATPVVGQPPYLHEFKIILQPGQGRLLRLVPFVPAYGRPNYFPGQELGYFIWCDADEKEWHIRWSTAENTLHNFTGTISCTSAFSESSIETYYFESSDTFWIDPVNCNPHWISFAASEGVIPRDMANSNPIPERDSKSPGHPHDTLKVFDLRQDGLDFVLCGYGNKVVEFDLQIDGLDQPEKVYIGANKNSPLSMPFCLIGPAGGFMCDETSHRK